MAILRRSYNGRKEYPGLTYLLRPTKNKKTLVYQGKRFKKVYEHLDTETAYYRALEEKEKGDRAVVWTGQRIKVRGQPARTYGIFVRRHGRRTNV